MNSQDAMYRFEGNVIPYELKPKKTPYKKNKIKLGETYQAWPENFVKPCTVKIKKLNENTAIVEVLSCNSIDLEMASVKNNLVVCKLQKIYA